MAASQALTSPWTWHYEIQGSTAKVLAKCMLLSTRESQIAWPWFQVSAADLVAWCRINLAQYKVPAQVHIRQGMPMTGSGKILKTALRTDYGPPAARSALLGMF